MRSGEQAFDKLCDCGLHCTEFGTAVKYQAQITALGAIERLRDRDGDKLLLPGEPKVGAGVECMLGLVFPEPVQVVATPEQVEPADRHPVPKARGKVTAASRDCN